MPQKAKRRPPKSSVICYRKLFSKRPSNNDGLVSLFTETVASSEIFYFAPWPTNTQLFHKLSHSYMFRHYRVILRQLVINTLPSYTSISNAAVGNTIYIKILIVNCIANSYIWNTCVTWQGIDCRLPEGDTIVSKHVSVWYFTFRGPCIVMYSYNKNQRDALFLKFILVLNSTCFGQVYCPSSGI